MRFVEKFLPTIPIPIHIMIPMLRLSTQNKNKWMWYKNGKEYVLYIDEYTTDEYQFDDK